MGRYILSDLFAGNALARKNARLLLWWMGSGGGLREMLFPKPPHIFRCGERDARAKDAHFHLAEPDVNAWGYWLSGAGRTKDALEIFKLNVSLYPTSATREPNNGNAAERIKILESPGGK